MAVPIGAIIGAVGSIVGGLNKATGKGKFGKGGGAPTLVDPRQSALVNLMQRERRAREVGTSDYAARIEAGKDVKRVLRNKARLGDSTLGDVSSYRTKIEDAITRGTAEERLGMLGPLVEETRNIADRQLDLVSLERERGLLKQTAATQNLQKNAAALAPTLMDAFKSKGKRNDSSKDGGNGGNVDWSKIANMAGKMVSSEGGGNGGGGNFDWGGLIQGIGGALGGGK